MMANYVGGFKLSRGLNLDIVAAQTGLQPQGDLEHGDDWYDPTALALVLDQLAIGAGVTCLFNATLIGARVTAGRIESVEIATRGGRQWIKGKTFIDCTGDAELSS